MTAFQMRYRDRFVRRIGLTLALLLALGAIARPAGADTVTDDNVAQLVQSAKTSADHQALADYFNAKAAAAGASAKKHEGMLSVMQGKPRELWRSHCKSLVRTFHQQQADYQALAKQQTKLAKQAGSQ